MTPTIHGQDLGLLRASDLLSELSTQATARSGGLPYPGATLQDDEDGQLVWSQVTGYFRAYEDGTLMQTESGDLRLTES